MKESKLLELLQKKRGFFEAILHLTREEEDIPPIEQWIPILEQKRVLLSCIEEIDSLLLPFKSTFPQLTEEMQGELTRTRGVIKEILDLDSVNQEKRKQILKQ